MRRGLLVIVLGLVVTIGWATLSASDTIGPGFYNDDLPVYTYAGSWTDTTLANTYLGDIHFSTCVGQSLTVEFFGAGLSLYANKQTNGATNAQICVDGSCVAVSFYAASTQYQQLIITVDGLDYGSHEFVLSCAQGAGYYQFVDAIHIFPFTTLPPTAVVQIEVTAEIIVEITAEPSPAWRASWDGGDGQPVAFEYSADAGQIAGVVLEAATLLVLLLLAFVVMFRGRDQSKT
jgi:hypothetical protein